MQDSCTHTIEPKRLTSFLKSVANRQNLQCFRCRENEYNNLQVCLFAPCKHVACTSSYNIHSESHHTSTMHNFCLVLKDHSVHCYSCKRRVSPEEHEGVKEVLDIFQSFCKLAGNDQTRTKENNGRVSSPLKITISSSPKVLERKFIEKPTEPVIKPIPVYQKEQESDKKEQITSNDDAMELSGPFNNHPVTWNLHFWEIPRTVTGNGLRNMGNTCYMNSVLQCLYSITPFRNALFLDSFYDPLDVSGALSKLFIEYHNAKNPLYPREFLDTFTTYFTFFSGFSQQDAHEFFRLLLDRIHEEIGYSQPSTVPKKFIKRSIISDLFKGTTDTEITCLRCKKTSLSRESFYELSLSIPTDEMLEKLRNGVSQKGWAATLTDWIGLTTGTEMTLQECIGAFCLPEELQGNNPYQCENCGQFTNAEKSTSISSLPEILCIHLKRFRFDNNASKISNIVKYPVNSLDMSNYGSLKGECKYNLVGVVNHQGSVNFGHYVAFAKRGQNWIEFNDSTTSRFNTQEFDDIEGYLLFYQRATSSSIKEFSKKISDQLDVEGFKYKQHISDGSCVGVNRLWWSQFSSGIDPGPANIYQFLCKHGNINPELDQNLMEMVQPIPNNIWKLIEQQFPRSKCLTKDNEVCGHCKEAIKVREKRRTEEMITIKSLDRKTLLPGETYYVVSSSWLHSLTDFLKGHTDKIPSEINNNTIFDSTTNSVRKGFQNPRDYKCVVPPVWKYIHSIYGGGPTITQSHAG